MYRISRAPTLPTLLKVTRFKDEHQVLSRHRWGLLGTWKRVEETQQSGFSVLSEPIILSTRKSENDICF